MIGPAADLIPSALVLPAGEILRKNTTDSSGHEHGADGKFVPKGKASSRNIGGTRAPRHVEKSPEARHAIFMIGGGGSGKGAFVQGYVGNHGDTDKTGEYVDEDHPEYVAPLGGFHHSRVFDADAIKKTIPGYERDNPSGPMNLAEFRKLSEDKQHGIQEWVRANTPFRSVKDFAQKDLGSSTKYGGGIIHELSSYVAKSKLRAAIADGKGGSFVYDSTGSEAYPEWAANALAAGYHVTYHHVDTPVEVAQHRNSMRERVVEADRLKGTHDKVARVAPVARAYAQAEHAKGSPIRYITSKNFNASDVKKAKSEGWTANGRKSQD